MQIILKCSILLVFVDPCKPDPCEEVENATSSCTPVNKGSFHCEHTCVEGHWPIAGNVSKGCAGKECPKDFWFFLLKKIYLTGPAEWKDQCISGENEQCNGQNIDCRNNTCEKSKFLYSLLAVDLMIFVMINYFKIEVVVDYLLMYPNYL